MRQAHAEWSQNTFACGIIWIYNLQPKQVNIKPRGKLSPKKALNRQLKWENSLCSKPSLLQEQEEDEVVNEKEIGLHLFLNWFWWLNCPTQIFGLTSLL
jgi:hypothetical protein